MSTSRNARAATELVIATAAAIAVGSIVLASPAAAAEVVAAGYDIQDRGPSIVADLVAIGGVGAGVLALARAKRGGGRTGALIAMAAAVVGIGIAAVALAVADGGPGTGNGVVGSGLAVVLGVVGFVLGWKARTRSRAADASA